MCLHSQKKQKKKKRKKKKEKKALLTTDVDCNSCIASCRQLYRFMCMVFLHVN